MDATKPILRAFPSDERKLVQAVCAGAVTTNADMYSQNIKKSKRGVHFVKGGRFFFMTIWSIASASALSMTVSAGSFSRSCRLTRARSPQECVIWHGFFLRARNKTCLLYDGWPPGPFPVEVQTDGSAIRFCARDSVRATRAISCGAIALSVEAASGAQTSDRAELLAVMVAFLWGAIRIHSDCQYVVSKFNSLIQWYSACLSKFAGHFPGGLRFALCVIRGTPGEDNPNSGYGFMKEIVSQ